ncbi:MAG TPA: hypothetical protein VGS41_18110 [Chthonomonadales bacterium]|nr:hypothetical protein [Chthonomonadales bacterium]
MKTWREELQNGKEPVVCALERPFAERPAGAKLLVFSPAEIGTYVRSRPAGAVRLMRQIRDDLAARHGAEGACPLTSGIFPTVCFRSGD